MTTKPPFPIIISEEHLEALRQRHVTLRVPFEAPELAEKIEKLIDFSEATESVKKIEATLARLRGRS